MKKYLRNYKYIKAFELTGLFILELIFLFVLISNKTLRSSIFVDRSLFILCMISYFTVLVSLAFLLVDMFKIKALRILDYELENIAYLDSKSGIPNRTSCDLFFETYSSKESLKGVGLIITEISNITTINAQNGKAFGDQSIIEFTQVLNKSAEGFGFIGRNGGNEYVTVIENCNEEKINKYINTLNNNIGKYNSTIEKGQLQIHSEFVLADEEDAECFSDLISKAYIKLRLQ